MADDNRLADAHIRSNHVRPWRWSWRRLLPRLRKLLNNKTESGPSEGTSDSDQNRQHREQ